MVEEKERRCLLKMTMASNLMLFRVKNLQCDVEKEEEEVEEEDEEEGNYDDDNDD